MRRSIRYCGSWAIALFLLLSPAVALAQHGQDTGHDHGAGDHSHGAQDPAAHGDAHHVTVDDVVNARGHEGNASLTFWAALVNFGLLIVIFVVLGKKPGSVLR